MISTTYNMNINGLLIINKPVNLTSFAAIELIKRRFNIDKICHCGTLDPLATGVLVLGLGNYVKYSLLLSNLTKRYLVHILFGLKSNTLDLNGKIIFFEEKNIYLSSKKIKNALISIKKSIYQVAPDYSSIKHNKIPLYKYAKFDININIKKRKIKIYKIQFKILNGNVLILDITCSKGTYIRSLVNYLSKKIGYTSCVIKLIRLSSGKFNILNSYTLEYVLKLKDTNNLKKLIL